MKPPIAAVDSSRDAIITLNLSGTIQTWNKSAERIFGYTAEEAVERPILLIIPEDLHAEDASIFARLRKGEFIEHYETVRRCKDGRFIDVALTVFSMPMRYFGGGSWMTCQSLTPGT